MRRLWVPLLLLVFAALVAVPARGATVPFSAPTNYGTASQPAAVAIGDFDSGAGLDFATFATAGQRFDSFLNNGHGGFGSGSPQDLGGASPAGVAGDLNGDGLDDVVAAVGTGASPGAKAFLANPNGSFTGVSPQDITGPVIAVGVGNVDGTGNLDAVTATFTAPSTEQLNVWTGQGNGHFTAGPAAVPAGTAATAALAVDDFNNDGVDDVALANFDANQIVVFLNNGSGALTAQPAITLGGQPGKPAAGDLNNDGRQDIAVPIFNSPADEGVDVLLAGTTGGTFTPHKLATSLTGDKGVAVAIGDLDDNGNLDLVNGRKLSPSTLNVLLGDGSGTGYSLDGTPTSTGNDLTDVQAGDLDEDGNVDLVETNQSTNNASVFLATPPTASVNPTSLNFGNQRSGTQSGTQTVTLTNNGPQTIGPLATITGSNREDFVRINDHCSPSSIFVPPGATCAIGVAFRPRSNGAKTATLEISSNAANSPQRVALSGTGVPASPVSQTAPSIGGSAVVGSTLSCSNGRWSNDPTSFVHQWLRNGAPIPGATTASYLVGEEDVGQQITCRVTASNAGGSASRTSNAVVPTAAAPRLIVAVPKQSLQSVVRKGLKFRSACANPCVITARLTGPVPPRKKKRRGRFASAARRATVGRVTATLAGATVRTLRVKVNRAGRAGVRHRRAALLRLRVVATDPSGTPSTTRTISVVVKRAKRHKTRR